MRKRWNPRDTDKQKELLLKLFKGDRSFTELLKSLKAGWSRQTLSLYLTDLVKKKCISKVRKVLGGKREIYHLEKDHPYVANILSRLALRDLHPIKSERELLNDWIEAMTFSLLNIIQIYIYRGRETEELKSVGNGKIFPIESSLGKSFSDLLETCKYYGEYLAIEIRMGNLDPDIVWEARDAILEDIKRKHSTK